MSQNQLATSTNNLTPDAVERALILQDLSKMNPEDRLQYYQAVCRSLGLNPLTRPFAYIVLNEKLTLYALKDCTEQLRKIHDVSLTIVARECTEGVYVVTARATLPNGRTDESIGAVPLSKEGGTWETAQSGKRYLKKDGTTIPLAGEDRANAFMRCETKAKRRVTLSICGLGMLDETEADSIPGAVKIDREEEARQMVQKGGDIELPDAQEQALEAKREAMRKKAAEADAEGEAPQEVQGQTKPADAPPWKEEEEDNIPMDEPKIGAAWESYVIAQVTVKEWNGRKLGDIEPKDIARLHSGWVVKHADAIKKNPAKQREADMVTAAHDHHFPKKD